MTIIQMRRGTAAEWTAANPTLASGEMGYETDTNKFKIGDGVTVWNSVSYFASGTSEGTGAYVTDLGAVTADVPITVTHNLGSFDISVQIIEKDSAGAGASAGSVVDATVDLTSLNAVDITFGANAAANLYRVIILSSGGASSVQEINAQTGTTYTPVATDLAKLVTLTNATAITVTLPQDSDLTFPVGGRIDFAIMGAGMATFTAGTGATVNATPSAVTRAQWSAATAIKRAANTWLVVGDLA